MLEEPWGIKLLGRLSAEKRTATIARFRTQQTGALLARLALFPRRLHSREELADLLWPDDTPEAARAKLRIALSSLRRQLEPPGAGQGSVILADRSSIRLNPNAFTTDVALFEQTLAHGQVSQALALYGGELLPGYYDDWIIDERERLEALRDQACSSTNPSQPAPEAADAPRSVFSAETPPSPHVHLPPQWTRFFGRAEEIESIRAWLTPADGETGGRLVTLTGPGGVGKTRLSLETARFLSASFPQGVYFIGLADVYEAERLLPLIAARLVPTDTLAEDPRRVIIETLQGAPALLVLDNLEQMADDIGPRIQNLLALVPTLRCLATSRRVLNVPGELAFPVAPLPIPTGAAPTTLGTASVALFVDRARAVRPDFGLTRGNAEAVGHLCARLEGLPLALELASAWIGVLTPAQMLARLEERAQPLVSRRKDGAERHQTLWAAVAWSFDLLPPSLRTIWAQLSVFRDGWTQEAMTAVCQTEESVEALSRLRDRSLITAAVSDDGSAVRYRMLDSLREFAQKQLTPEQGDAVARSHSAFFLRLAEDADGCYNGPQQAASLNRMEADHENIRAAMDWYAADPESGADGLLLAAALQRFWWLRGHFEEGRKRSARALSHPNAPRDGRPRVRTLSGVSVLANLQGDPDAAQTFSLEALEILRTMDRPGAVAVVLGSLGNIAKGRGDFDSARRYYAECLEKARAVGADAVSATALVNLGNLAMEQDNWDTARRNYVDSLALMRSRDNTQGVIVALNNLGSLDTRTGDFRAARLALDECLTLCQELMDKGGVAYALEAYARLALAERTFPLAATLYAAAAALRRALGTPLRGHELPEFGRDQASLQSALGQTGYASACASGTALSLEDAISLALGRKTGTNAGIPLAK